MKWILLLLFPFSVTGQIFLGSTSSSATLGNTSYPLNTISLIRSAATDYIGFAYATIPTTTVSGYFNPIIIRPTLYSLYYTVSGPDTTYFASAADVIAWYNTNAITTTGGGLAELQSTYIGVGNSSNELSGSANLIYDGTTDGQGFGVSHAGMSIVQASVNLGYPNIVLGDVGALANGTSFFINDQDKIIHLDAENISIGTDVKVQAIEALQTFSVSAMHTVISGDLSLSATGGAGQYLSQTTSGGAITVATIPISDISGAVSTSGSYANPAWITSLAASKITGLSVTSANGFAGSFSSGAATITTTVNGLAKGNGTALSAATYSDVAALTGAPVFANLTTTGTGVAVAFTFTIANGYTYANFQSQNTATPAVIMSSISGTTLTITCASAPILSAGVSFGGFYK